MLRSSLVNQTLDCSVYSLLGKQLGFSQLICASRSLKKKKYKVNTFYQAMLGSLRKTEGLLPDRTVQSEAIAVTIVSPIKVQARYNAKMVPRQVRGPGNCVPPLGRRHIRGVA